jgi:isocitrate/isopropylmalate dehydrogenase
MFRLRYLFAARAYTYLRYELTKTWRRATNSIIYINYCLKAMSILFRESCNLIARTAPHLDLTSTIIDTIRPHFMRNFI